MAERLLIDTDLRDLNDDGFALHYLLQSGTRIDHVSTVFGNSTAARSAVDVACLRDQYAGANFTVAKGREQPAGWAEHQSAYRSLLATLPHSTYLAAFGPDQPLLSGPAHPDSSQPPAIPCQPAGSVVDVITLGPLSNVADALTTGSFDSCTEVHLLVCAGSFGRGNVTSTSEFNAFADPLALDLVLASTVFTSITLVPLDVSEAFGYDRAQFEIVRGGNSVFGRLLGLAKQDLFDKQPTTRDRAWDLAAALLWRHPELRTEGFDARVAVQLPGGPHPGRTFHEIPKSSRRKVHVITAIDYDRARQLFAEAFT